VLGIAYRASKLDKEVAGLQAITPKSAGEPLSGVVESIDVTGLVGGHWDYRPKLKTLVQLVGLSSGRVAATSSLLGKMSSAITGSVPPVPGLASVAAMVKGAKLPGQSSSKALTEHSEADNRPE